jgi:hypothetical protein
MCMTLMWTRILPGTCPHHLTWRVWQTTSKPCPRHSLICVCRHKVSLKFAFTINSICYYIINTIARYYLQQYIFAVVSAIFVYYTWGSWVRAQALDILHYHSLSLCSLAYPDKWQVHSWNWGMTVSLHILSNSVYTCRHAVWGAEIIAK